MDTAEELGNCADEVERACARLVEGTPDALDRCRETLDRAVHRMSLVLSGFLPSAEALANAWRLRRTVRNAAALLESAAAYHRGWRERVSVKVSGYAPGGTPGEIAAPGTIWLEA